MAGPVTSLQLVCGAVTAKLDTRRVNPGARALPGPGLAGFIRPLWVTGSAVRVCRRQEHIAAGSLGPTIVRVMANRREQTLGTGEIHDRVAASSFPGFAPDPSGTAILSTGSCRTWRARAMRWSRVGLRPVA